MRAQIPPAPLARLVLSAMLAVVLVACGSSGPTRTISELTLTIDDDELAVGEQTWGSVRAMTTDLCLFESPCEMSVRVSLWVSGVGGVALSNAKVMTPGSFMITGTRPGMVKVHAEADHHYTYRSVQVLAASAGGQ